jgi:hypothetical protein
MFSMTDSPISETSDYAVWLGRAFNAYYSKGDSGLHVEALPCPEELRLNSYEDWYIHPRGPEFGYIVSQSTIEEIRRYNGMVLLFALSYILVSFFLFMFVMEKLFASGWFWVIAMAWFSVLVAGILLASRPLRQLFARQKRISFPEEFTAAVKKKDRRLLVAKTIGRAGSGLVGAGLEGVANKAAAKAGEIATEYAIDKTSEHFSDRSK